MDTVNKTVNVRLSLRSNLLTLIPVVELDYSCADGYFHNKLISPLFFHEHLSRPGETDFSTRVHLVKRKNSNMQNDGTQTNGVCTTYLPLNIRELIFNLLHDVRTCIVKKVDYKHSSHLKVTSVCVPACEVCSVDRDYTWSQE